MSTLIESGELTMMIDAHTHIFKEMNGLIRGGATRATSYGRITIGGNEMQFMSPLCEKVVHSVEMLIAQMDWAGVDHAVLVQGSFYGNCNEVVTDAVRHYPDRLAGFAFIDPWGPECGNRYTSLVSECVYRGIKLECSEETGFCGIHKEAELGAQELHWLWRDMESRGLVLVLDLGSVGSRAYQTSAVRHIAVSHPNLKIVIAHLGQPNGKVSSTPALLREWQEQIDLGLLPNIWFDTASLPNYFLGEGYPYVGVKSVIRLAMDRIGPEKVMWGTDIPGLLKEFTYKQLVELATVHTDFLSASDRSLVLGGNAAHVFGFRR